MNKTIDGRFIEKRVKIDGELLKGILGSIKLENKLTWAQLAERLGVCSQMVRHDWLMKDKTIPLSVLKK